MTAAVTLHDPPSHRSSLSASSRQAPGRDGTAATGTAFYCKSPLAACSLTCWTSASTTKPCYDQQASSDSRRYLECPQGGSIFRLTDASRAESDGHRARVAPFGYIVSYIVMDARFDVSCEGHLDSSHKSCHQAMKCGAGSNILCWSEDQEPRIDPHLFVNSHRLSPLGHLVRLRQSRHARRHRLQLQTPGPIWHLCWRATVIVRKPRSKAPANGGAAERKGGWTILNRCSPDSRLGPHFKGPARFRPILPRSPRAETRLKGTLALRTAAAPRSHRRRPRPPPRRPTKQAAVQSRHAPTARSG